MSSVIPLTFNAVELRVVTINEKPWTRDKEVCRALEYNKKTTNIVKAFCSQENYTHKWQLSSVSCTPISWPRWDSNKLDLYISKEGVSGKSRGTGKRAYRIHEHQNN